jgi:hypothetical protein
MMRHILECAPRCDTGTEQKRHCGSGLGAGAMVAISLGLPLTLLIASIISTGLETDTIAISQAPHCGT